MILIRYILEKKGINNEFLRICTLNTSSEKIYRFLTNFRESCWFLPLNFTQNHIIVIIPMALGTLKTFPVAKQLVVVLGKICNDVQVLLSYTHDGSTYTKFPRNGHPMKFGRNKNLPNINIRGRPMGISIRDLWKKKWWKGSRRGEGKEVRIREKNVNIMKKIGIKSAYKIVVVTTTESWWLWSGSGTFFTGFESSCNNGYMVWFSFWAKYLNRNQQI